MKFMKLGTRPDTFYSAEATRSISSDVSSDLIVQINSSRYLLHKFPLLSRCGRLQSLISESNETDSLVNLLDFPGGTEAFELCAKFCYGITITLGAHNIVSALCAAEFLQMTEDVENGNLFYKLEVFLASCVLKGWKDTIIALQSTKALPKLSEELKITSRCVDSIVYRVLLHPSKISWAYSYSVRGGTDVCQNNDRNRSNPRTWWGEDISELCVDHYLRVMLAVKSSGNRVPTNLIGEALQRYAFQWLPIMSKENHVKNSSTTKNSVFGDKMILEAIVSLLPAERNCIPCRFLLRLLKACNFIGASNSAKLELARRVGMQLEDACVEDLLIPSLSYSEGTLYDVEIVHTILEEFMVQWSSPPTSPQREQKVIFCRERRRSRSTEDVELQMDNSRRSSSASHCSKLKVAKILDGFLQEVARDPNLPMEKVIELAEKIPDFARPDHDDLYRVIDIYLKAHPTLSKSERKQLCRLLDCRKLSMEVCKHAAQNELLPLRVVVQVLFFEQVKAGMSGNQVSELPSNIKNFLSPTTPNSEDQTSKQANLDGPSDDAWSISMKLQKPNQSTAQSATTLRMRLAETENDSDEVMQFKDGKNSKLKSIRSIPTGPKKMLSKLWAMNKSASEKQR